MTDAALPASRYSLYRQALGLLRAGNGQRPALLPAGH